jgi:glutathione synthase/RimK-type ligase-like ATP-grasp enzyme
VRALILVPDPAFPESSAWALDVEAAALRDSGIAVVARPWTDIGDIDGIDVVLPLVAWGYQFDTARWLGLIDTLEAAASFTLNPVPVLRWNSDKAYLLDLAKVGVPTIPTLRYESFDEAALGDARQRFAGVIVIKPPVSAAAYDTYRLAPADPLPPAAMGRAMLAQPFLRAVQDEGEYSLLFFGGAFSHALVKRPKRGDYRVQPHLGGRETLCDPPEGAIALAEAALAAAPERCVYARVDLLRDDEGALRVIELELIEPALWLDFSPSAPAAFASAVRAAVEAARQ